MMLKAAGLSSTMCCSPLLLLLFFAPIFHIVASKAPYAYLVEVEGANHAKANSSSTQKSQHPQVKEDKKDKQVVDSHKNYTLYSKTNVAFDSHKNDTLFSNTNVAATVDGHKGGRDYNNDDDWASASKEEEEISDSDYSNGDEDSSEESESGSSEFQRKLNDPEYTTIVWIGLIVCKNQNILEIKSDSWMIPNFSLLCGDS